MLIWYFSNNLDIYDYVGKLPKQHFSVQLFSNPGDKILFLLKFNEARISEWNLLYQDKHKIFSVKTTKPELTTYIIGKLGPLRSF